MNESGLKNPNPLGSALFPSRRLPLKSYKIVYMYSYKGLFTCRWGPQVGEGPPASGDAPPGRDRLHLYLRRSLRDQKHQEAEIRRCCETSWADVTIYFLFGLWIEPF